RKGRRVSYSYTVSLHDALPISVGREVWVEIADSLRAVITDEVIEEAIRQWPDPVFEEVGVYTIESLKARRDKLPEVANQYYDLRSEEHTSEVQSREKLVRRLVL